MSNIKIFYTSIIHNIVILKLQPLICKFETFKNKYYFLEKISFASQNYQTEAYKPNSWLILLQCVSHYLPDSVYTAWRCLVSLKTHDITPCTSRFLDFRYIHLQPPRLSCLCVRSLELLWEEGFFCTNLPYSTFLAALQFRGLWARYFMEAGERHATFHVKGAPLSPTWDCNSPFSR